MTNEALTARVESEARALRAHAAAAGHALTLREAGALWLAGQAALADTLGLGDDARDVLVLAARQVLGHA